MIESCYDPVFIQICIIYIQIHFGLRHNVLPFANPGGCLSKACHRDHPLTSIEKSALQIAGTTNSWANRGELSCIRGTEFYKKMDLETQKAGPPPQAIAAQDEAAKKEMAAAERGTIGAFSSFVKDLVTWSVPSLSSSSEKVPQEEPKTSDGLMSYAEAEASAEAAEIEHTEGPMPSSPVDKDYRLATRAETALEIGREALAICSYLTWVVR